MYLHWGVAFKNIKEWVCQDENYLPVDSQKRDAKAAQSKFQIEGKRKS